MFGVVDRVDVPERRCQTDPQPGLTEATELVGTGVVGGHRHVEQELVEIVTARTPESETPESAVFGGAEGRVFGIRRQACAQQLRRDLWGVHPDEQDWSWADRRRGL